MKTRDPLLAPNPALGPRPLETTPGYELYNAPTPKVTYLVDKLIGVGSQFVFTGGRASWKSWALTHMGICIAAPHNPPFLTQFKVNPAVPGQGAVLFIQLEERPRQAQKKYQWLLRGNGMNRQPAAIQDMLMEYIVGRAFVLDEEGRVDQLKIIIDRLKPDLVIWDSLRRMLRGNSNDDEFALRLVYNLSLLQEVWPSAHGVVAHIRKKSADRELNEPGERGRGTSAVPDQMDTVFDVERNRADDFVTVTHVKNRDGVEHPDFNYRMRIVDSDALAYPEWIGTTGAPRGEPSNDDCAAAIMVLVGDGTVHATGDLIALLARRFNEPQVRRALRNLEMEGHILIDKSRPKRHLVGRKPALQDVGGNSLFPED